MIKKKEFDEVIILSNIKRILLIGSIYTLIEIVGLTLSTLGFFESDIRLYVLFIVLFHLIYLPTLFIYTYKKKERNFKILEKLEILYFPIIIAWAALFTALMYLSNHDITIYSMALFVCSAVFIMRPLNAKLLFSASIVFFGILIYSFVDSVPDANALLFKSLIVTVLAYVITRTNHRIRIQLYETNRVLSIVNEELKTKVDRDSLTGLYNNGFAFDYIDKAIVDSKKSKSNLSLMMIDIDDFKMINDKHGHLEGDKVIQSMSNVLNQLINDDDIAARYGGEEFIIILNNMDLGQASVVANRILEAVRNLKFTFGDQVTISIGVAEYAGDTRETLIKKADEQLYLAKGLGKNQVCDKCN